MPGMLGATGPALGSTGPPARARVLGDGSPDLPCQWMLLQKIPFIPEHTFFLSWKEKNQRKFFKSRYIQYLVIIYNGKESEKE